MNFIMSNEYWRIWFKERGTYERDFYFKEQTRREESKIKRRFVQRNLAIKKTEKPLPIVKLKRFNAQFSIFSENQKKQKQWFLGLRMWHRKQITDARGRTKQRTRQREERNCDRIKVVVYVYIKFYLWCGECKLQLIEDDCFFIVVKKEKLLLVLLQTYTSKSTF